jgi:hypothetical protein
LAPAIHDVSKSVRISFVDLLTKIKMIRSIKYFEIVDVDDILMRLACDSDKIVDQICKLISNSFFPFEKSISIQISRLLDFIERNSTAAKKFYQNVSKFVPLSSVSKLIHVVNKYLKKIVQSKKSKKKLTQTSDDSPQTIQQQKKRKLRKQEDDQEKEEKEEQEEKESSSDKYLRAAENVPLIESLVEVQYLMLESTLKAIREAGEEELYEVSPHLQLNLKVNH